MLKREVVQFHGRHRSDTSEAYVWPNGFAPASPITTALFALDLAVNLSPTHLKEEDELDPDEVPECEIVEDPLHDGNHLVNTPGPASTCGRGTLHQPRSGL